MARLRRFLLLVALVPLLASCHLGDERGSSFVVNETADHFYVAYKEAGDVHFLYDLPPGAIGAADVISYPKGYRLQILTTDCEMRGSIRLDSGFNATAVGEGGEPRRAGEQAVPPDMRNTNLLILGDTCGSPPSAAPSPTP